MDHLLALNIKLNRWLFKTAKKIVNLSVGELYTLWKIHSKGTVKIGELTYDAGVTANALAGMLDRFESMGYVVRVHDVMDRRSVLICETPKLDALIKEWEKAVNAELQAFCGALPDEAAEQLKKSMNVMQQFLDKVEE